MPGREITVELASMRGVVAVDRYSTAPQVTNIVIIRRRTVQKPGTIAQDIETLATTPLCSRVANRQSLDDRIRQCSFTAGVADCGWMFRQSDSLFGIHQPSCGLFLAVDAQGGFGSGLEVVFSSLVSVGR